MQYEKMKRRKKAHHEKAGISSNPAEGEDVEGPPFQRGESSETKAEALRGFEHKSNKTVMRER